MKTAWIHLIESGNLARAAATHFTSSREAAEAQELERRERIYQEGRLFPDVRGRTVILVDDGLATGSTMRAAAAALRTLGAARLVVAVPVAPKESCDAMREVVDEVVCARVPERFQAVGEWYEDFSQTSDQEVSELLRRRRREAPG